MPGLRVGWAVAPEDTSAKSWARHDYTTLTPGTVGDRLAGVTMRPDVRETVLARTRPTARANVPRLEAWVEAHPYFRYVRPVAGASAYVGYDPPGPSSALVAPKRSDA